MSTQNLERFIIAQKKMYSIALSEIKSGKKETHWMWYIFPQLRGLGFSATAYTYGIADLNEAKAYLAHPVLSQRLIEITEALLDLNEDNAEVVLGETDAMKLKSSMTLFASINEENSVFHRVLKKFYNGKKDDKTIKLIK